MEEGDTTVVLRTASADENFDTVHKNLNNATSADDNAYDPENPIDSLLNYCVQEVLYSDFLSSMFLGKVSIGKRAKAAAVIQKIFQANVFKPIQEFIKADIANKNNFSIPPEDVQTFNAFMSVVSAKVFLYSSDIFPKHSWPWTLSREAVFVLNNQTKYTGMALQSIFDSEQTGPIGFLATSMLLNKIKSPYSSVFARKGLSMLSSGNFRKDCRLLFEGDSLLSQSFNRLIEALQYLNEEDINALNDILTPVQGKFLRDSRKLMKENKGKPTFEILAPSLDELWKRELEYKTQKLLFEYSLKFA